MDQTVSARTRRVIEELEREACGWDFACSLAEGDAGPDGGNAELRGEVALLKRPRHGGK
jgi:hypothetical protein